MIEVRATNARKHIVHQFKPNSLQKSVTELIISFDDQQLLNDPLNAGLKFLTSTHIGNYASSSFQSQRQQHIHPARNCR